MQGGVRSVLCILGLAFCGLLAAGSVQAGGGMQETSAGNVDISVVIGGRVRIFRVTDIDLSTYPGTGDLIGDSQLCVYRNDSGLYNITISSDYADGSTFRVANGTNFISYSVDFSDDQGNQFVDVASGARLSGLVGHTFSPGCQGRNNASLDVRFSEGALQDAAPGSYQDVITLLVEPG